MDVVSFIAIPLLALIMGYISAIEFKKKKIALICCTAVLILLSTIKGCDDISSSHKSKITIDSLNHKLAAIKDTLHNVGLNINIKTGQLLVIDSQILKNTLLPKTVFITTIKNTSTENINDDSSNYVYYHSRTGDTVIVYPKHGVWAKPYLCFDSKLESKNSNLYQSDGTTNSDSLHPTQISLNGKQIDVIDIYMSMIRSKDKPLYLNISGDKHQRVIFGDYTNLNKRYMYKNGKITWIPEK